MRLEDYLEALKICPDDQLAQEYGFEDNMPFFLNIDFNSIIQYLKKSGRYNYRRKIKNEDGINNLFDYVPGTVNLQVFNWIPPFYCSGSDEDKQRQKRDYNITIMLHYYQEKKISDVSRLRALAIVADDIGQMIIKENIPACIPRSIGWKYLNTEDFSRIVYHEPTIKKSII